MVGLDGISSETIGGAYAHDDVLIVEDGLCSQKVLGSFVELRVGLPVFGLLVHGLGSLMNLTTRRHQSWLHKSILESKRPRIVRLRRLS